MAPRFVRAKAAAPLVARGITNFYAGIKEGVIPPGIKAGARKTVWPVAELEAISRAVAAGADRTQQRILVGRLVESRAQALATLLGGGQ